ncbi:MAG: peroxiredoxin-like family protein [Bacteriovoracaceae bacterium]
MKSIIVIIFFSLTFISFAESLESKLKEKKESSKASPETKAILKKGIDHLIESKLKDQAMSLLGSKLPEESFINEIGMPITTKSLYKNGTIVLNFYRGGWCPYCMLELEAYQKLLNSFKQSKITVIALTPDQYREINKTRKKFNLTFPIYSDKNNQLAKKLGLAFKVDQDTISAYKNLGIDLQAFQNNDEWMLPMPGVYVIDQTGTIRHIEVDPDYTKRAEPSKILEIAKSLSM